MYDAYIYDAAEILSRKDEQGNSRSWIDFFTTKETFCFLRDGAYQNT